MHNNTIYKILGRVKMFWKLKWWILIILFMLVVVSYSVSQIILYWPSDFSGWGQLIVEIFTLPIIAYELNKLRKAFENIPEINIGVVSASSYPLSNIRSIDNLPTVIVVSRGYPFFNLVVRNHGKISAKSVKIHLEFIGHKPTREPVNSLLSPVIRVYDEGNLNAFSKLTGADFLFLGKLDWHVRPLDSEIFSFFIGTCVRNSDEKSQLTDEEIDLFYPYPCECEFNCLFWAEGLEKPVEQKISVIVQEKDNDGIAS